MQAWIDGYIQLALMRICRVPIEFIRPKKETETTDRPKQTAHAHTWQNKNGDDQCKRHEMPWPGVRSITNTGSQKRGGGHIGWNSNVQEEQCRGHRGVHYWIEGVKEWHNRAVGRAEELG